MRKIEKRKKGFTIVELLAVIVLMAIVAVMGFVGVRTLLKSGKRQTLNTKTSLLLKNAVTFADESAAVFNGCYCKIDNQWTDCRIITVQDLIDQGSYTTSEKCGNKADCVLNDLYSFRDDDDVDFKKESLNDESIVLFKRNNQYIAEFTSKMSDESVRSHGCSYSNIKAKEVKIVTRTNKTYVSFDNGKRYMADELYYDITLESDLPIISIKYCTSTGANCDQFNKTIQAQPNVKHYSGKLDIKVSNPVRLCVQAVDEMRKVTTQCSDIYYFDPSTIKTFTTSTPRCYINGVQSTTNCPVSGTNRYIADYTEVDYSTSKETSKYNYFKKVTIENSSGKPIEVTASSKGTESNSAGKYSNTFTAINPDIVSGKVTSRAASGNEYKPINYKLTYKSTDTSEHSKSTTSPEMNVIIKYKVIYNANGGTGSMDPSIFRYNQNVSLRTNTFTRVGYTYQGWARQTSGTVIANSGTNYSDGKQDDVNLYAQWKAKEYNITLTNTLATVTGSTSVKATYDSASLSSAITNPQRVYTITFAKGTSGASFSPTSATSTWTFTGWWTAQTGGTKIIGADGKLVSNVSGYTDASGRWKRDGAVTLYSQWSGGNISVPNPTRTGYTCTFGSVLNPPTANKTYTATCTPNKYQVTFSGNNCGTPNPTSKQVTYDAKYGDLATISKTGYTQKGWWTAASGGTQVTKDTTVKITGAQTLYAHCSAKTYTITLTNTNATTAGTKSVTATYDSANLSSAITNPQRKYTITFSAGTSGASFSPTSAQSNWNFTGWYTSDGKMVIGTNGKLVANVAGYTNASGQWIKDGNVTLNAQWSGGTISVPNPTRNGYTCTFGTVTNPPTATKTYTATCKANTYTVTFNANGGGTPSPTSKTVTFDSTYGNLATTTWAVHRFDGWFTAASGGSQVTSTTKVTTASNHTLYAHWTAVCYTGYTQESDGKCHKYYDATANCPSGYTSTGTNCSKTTTIDATKGCPSGYTDNGTKCEKTTKVNANKSCPSGYTDNGSKCVKTSTYSAYVTGYSGGCDWKADSGHFSTRNIQGSDTIYKASLPDCGDSTLGDQYKVHDCGAGKHGKVNASGTGYSCSNYNGDRYTYKLYTCECYGSKVYGCNSGDSLSGSTCTHTKTKSYTYSCNSGYTLDGKKCYKTETHDYTYSCPSGYTLSGKKCSKTETVAYTYTCPSGGTLSGTKCNLVRNLGE